MKFFALAVGLLFSVLISAAQAPHLQHRATINVEDWTFKKGTFYQVEKTAFRDDDWEKVKVPHTFSMDAIEGPGYYRGDTWYRTRVNVPATMADQRVFIRFEGVGHDAQVFVNEKNVGRHVGGYSAFCYEITHLVKAGQENVVAVKVSNSPDYKRIPVNDKLFNHYGGIYRPVHIFSTPPTAISPVYHASSGLFVELKEIKNNAAALEVRTYVINASARTSAQLNYVVRDGNGNEILTSQQPIDLSGKEQLVSYQFEIKNPVLWKGKKNPHRYTITATLTAGNTTDQVTQTFGIRTYAIDPDNGFKLNNLPYRLYGVNMHEEWKQTGPALKLQQHEADMQVVNELGATSLRASHYQHSDKMYQLADELGVLVWAEIPFVNDYSGREGQNAKQQLTELILQNYNHPSIFVWGLWNEVRANNSPDEPCVVLTKELNALAHELDKTRMTTSASDKEMQGNMENITDLQAWNKYFGWYYGQYEDMAKWLDESHRQFPRIPIGISEYGIEGNIYHQDKDRVEKPFGNYFPEMEQAKYHELTWKYFKDRPFLWGTYIWCMFDFSVSEWNRGGIPSLNHKGLITYDRSVKKDAFYFYKANWSDEPVLYIAERRNTERKNNLTTVKVYTNLSGATLYVNDKKAGAQKTSSDTKVMEFQNINLNKGPNTIKVMSADGKLKDEVIWTVMN